MILMQTSRAAGASGASARFPQRGENEEETLRAQRSSARRRRASNLAQAQAVPFASFSFRLSRLHFHCCAFQVALMIREILGMLITRDLVITAANSFEALSWKLWGYFTQELVGNKTGLKARQSVECPSFNCYPDCST